ncbi:MAG: 50S ribosomal protein L11 methyltransferase [Gammaproteobacteria bacterium]|nr:MAG: 50S ribosomal protein L11 methyltransferase [Gammaproteobacteria bacterium]
MASDPQAPITWLQLRFVCAAATASQLAEHLSDCGALAVSLDDAEHQPLYEPEPGVTPLWSSTRVSGLFPSADDSVRLLAELQRRLAPQHLPEAAVEVLADREWTRLYQDAFEPTCFGGRLWVVPSWAEAVALEDGQVSLSLDPGLAFGTGGHATTAMCLAWLAGEHVADGEAVDYGCGSGILAVAAAKLGARRVWAVDSDPQALQATRRNAAANAVGSRVEVRAPLNLPPLTVDLLVSNILANTLSSMAETLSMLLAPGGRLALAGILEEQAPAVVASFAPWCTLRPVALRDDWVLLAGNRGD